MSNATTDIICTMFAYDVARRFNYRFGKINSPEALCFIAALFASNGITFTSDAAAARARKAVRRAAISLSK